MEPAVVHPPESASMKANLAALHGMSNFLRWQYESVRPFLGAETLEAGCGTGNLSRMIVRTPGLRRYVGVDYAPALVEEARAVLNAPAGVDWTVEHADLESADVDRLAEKPFDSVLCLNVLEHIADDVHLLKQFRKLLRPGGRVVLLVPAFQWLYGSIDRVVQHHRRYSRADIHDKLRRAGFEVAASRYFNLLGIPAWIWHGKILRLKVHHESEMKAWDRLVPLLSRFERTVPIPCGLSLLVVGEVK